MVTMNITPFLVLGLVNGMVVGLVAALVARGISPGDSSMRFRDAAVLGMLGSVGGSLLASLIDSQDGYLASGPSSLLFSIIGAALAIGGIQLAQQRKTSEETSRSWRP